ncbi:MAG: M56 family metallopeptidase [Saprospiraceae bacterium]
MQYLIESSICLALLYAFYHLALRRESFFQFNRGYLLLAPLLAFVAPALNIRLEQEVQIGTSEPAVEAISAPVVEWPVVVERLQVAPRLIGQTLEKPVWTLSLGTVVWWIYILVGALFLLRLLVQIYRLARFIRLCKKEARDGFVLASGPAETPIASFFGFVFWNPGNLADEDRQLIFEHELVHVRQWHSLDLIFIELLIALQWFNPLLYAYRRSLREVHEYIADDYVVRRTRQRYAYAALLVRQHSTGNGAQPGLVNTFHSLIQKRLIMMAKQPSRPLRRAKYLLALPLFATLMLLFSFRLADKLPEVRNATALLETYANTLSETVVLGDKPAERFEPKPYIFYWGNFEVRLNYEEHADQYKATLNLTAEALREAIKQEPRLWTGETLTQRLSFKFNGISVSSDYNRPEVYETIQIVLRSNTKVLQEGDQVVISNISLPEGPKGQITIVIEKSAVAPTPVVKPEITSIFWGGKTFVQGEKRYVTVSEFWKMLQSEALVRFSDQKEVQPKAWNVALYNEKGAVIRARADRIDALSTEQLRARLGQETETIKPGAMLSFSAWELQAYEASPETLDTIITFDPVTYEETVQIITKSGGVVNLLPATELISLSIVKDLDPRRFLKVEDLKDYTFKWSALTEYIPRSVFAQSYISKGLGNRIHGDGSITMWSNQFTKKEILLMLREKPQFFQGKIPLDDFNFTISYNGDGKLIENGTVPADLIEKLEKELKPGEVVKITGLQARENPVRYVVMTMGANNKPNYGVKFSVKEAETLAIDNDQHLARFTLTVPEFDAIRPKLENLDDIWLQYGDIDLTQFTFELEVRDEDPKPALPATAKKGGIFTVKLSVSPNPVNAQQAANATVSVQKAGEGILTVTNLEGKQLFAKKVAIEPGENKLEIPAQALNTPGVYIIRLEMPFGVGSAKLVVE